MAPAPTVGRIVHFYDHSPQPVGGKPNNGAGAGPYVGIVVQVFPGNPTNMANLRVLVPFNGDHDAGSVPHKSAVPNAGEPYTRYWEWQPVAPSACYPGQTPTVDESKNGAVQA